METGLDRFKKRVEKAKEEIKHQEERIKKMQDSMKGAEPDFVAHKKKAIQGAKNIISNLKAFLADAPAKEKELKANESLSSQIKKLAEDLNANGELTSDVEIIIEPEVKDDALNYCDSCDKTSEECVCDNEEDCDCSELDMDEKDDKIAKMEAEVKKLGDLKHDAYAKYVDEKEKYGSSDAFYNDNPVLYRKLMDAHHDANAKWDTAWNKLQKMKKQAKK